MSFDFYGNCEGNLSHSPIYREGNSDRERWVDFTEADWIIMQATWYFYFF